MKANETILVTGGAGFIGSNFVEYALNENPDLQIVNLDKLTYAGSLDNLNFTGDNHRHTFVHGDICDEELLRKLFKEHRIGGVIHFAAESHVDNSINAPDDFIQTNINGTFKLLEVCRSFWKEQQPKGRQKFLHVSTDEVYGSLGETGFFTEASAYAPNSPYSASKAASDLLVRSYHRTYGLNATITNCSNNYGPKQHDEKLIPTIVRNALNRNPIPIYGDGSNVRDWLFVADHCRALHMIYESESSGQQYAIGGDQEESNLQIARQLCALLDQILPWEGHSYKELINFVQDRPGHDFRYAIQSSKLKKATQWEALKSFEQGLTDTINWYISKYKG